MVYRTLMKVRRHDVSQWDSDYAQKVAWWDRAVKGSSTLQAALRRCLRCELANLEGQDATQIL